MLGVVTRASSQPEVPPISFKFAPDCGSFPAKKISHQMQTCVKFPQSNIRHWNLPCGTMARARALLSSISAALGLISFRP